MNKATRPAGHYVDEGSAFAALEMPKVRAAATQRGERAMSHTTEQTSSEAHAAPMEAWDAIAGDYDAYVAPGEAGIATDALRLAGLKAGDRILDVAAGTGGLGVPAARLGATVVATDWSPKMIETFEARVRQEGLSGAEGRVMDCHVLDFVDDSFDITGSQFGVMLVPDQQRALREMVRVTKRGGRVLLIAYGNPAQFEALHLFVGALRSVVPSFEGLPDDPPPLEFQVSDPQVLRTRLEQAGLTHVKVDTAHEERLELRSGQQLWDWCLGGNPIPGMLVADLSDPQKAAVKQSLDAMIRERANDAGVAIVTAPLNIGIGTK
jgi:ubiquinone/menaquinone biosynthesis C-methylase UbiE